MRAKYRSFANYRQVFPDIAFDWTSDGCSDTPPAWADPFGTACEQHDFGYRNYGHGDGPHALRLSVDEDTRGWIDGRLLTEMRRICNDKYHALWYRLNLVACRDEAAIIFGVVRPLGRTAYYH